MDLVDILFILAPKKAKTASQVSITSIMKQTVLLILFRLESEVLDLVKKTISGLLHSILPQPLMSPMYCCCRS